MTDLNNKITTLERELETKSKELIDLKKSIPKQVLLLFAFSFIFPFIPSRKGKLIDEYSYGNAVLFTGIISTLVLLLGFYHMRKLKKEIFELEMEIDYEKIKKTE